MRRLTRFRNFEITPTLSTGLLVYLGVVGRYDPLKWCPNQLYKCAKLVLIYFENSCCCELGVGLQKWTS